jgi:lysozyme
MILQNVQKMLILQEGCKLMPYKCSEGKLTIGVGRNIQDRGISEKEALYLLTEDIKACHKDLSTFFFPYQFDMLPELIQDVLMSMRFQLGHTGLKGFKKMLFAFQTEDYLEAIKEMKNSRWYLQTPDRADELIGMVEKAMGGAE